MSMVTLDDIYESVTESFKYKDRSTLSGKSRKRECIDGRTVYFHLARKHGFTLKECANHLSRDHTTAIHHVNKANNLLKTDSMFTNKYMRALFNLKHFKRTQDAKTV